MSVAEIMIANLYENENEISVVEIMIANLYENEMSVAEMMIADSCDLMWSDPLIAMTCADTPTFVELYRISPEPFLMYVNCFEVSEIDETEGLIDADN